MKTICSIFKIYMRQDVDLKKNNFFFYFFKARKHGKLLDVCGFFYYNRNDYF